MANLCTLGVALLLCSTIACRADVVIDFKYVRVESAISPVKQTFRYPDTGGFRLQGQQVGLYSGNGKYFTKGDNTRRLETINNSGIHLVNTFSFRRKSITQTVSHPGFVSSTTIRTDGASACSAKTTFRPLSGHRYIEGTNNNNPMIYAEMHAENETCQIRQAPQ